MIEIDPHALPANATTLPARPVAIDGLFGWFSPGLNRRGVILCGTLGYEQLSACRPWRALAEGIAGTGCATLRFDYPGEGDSADAGAGRTAAWLAAIGRAVRFMREAGEAEEVVLVGLRLGATLAALAARQARVDRLVLMAPFASGKAYLREMRLQASTTDVLPDGTPYPQDPAAPIVGGFRIGPDLVADLTALTLADVEQAAPAQVLILGADPAKLGLRYAAAGSAVTTLPFPGLPKLIANPLFSQTPTEAFDGVVGFVAREARPRPRTPDPTLAPAVIAEGDWIEEPVRFGAGFFGILCRPVNPSPDGPRVLFANSGANVRSGYGRQATALARRLAAGGVTSLRMDLRGIGDSPDRPDGSTPVYAADALDDVRAGVEALAARGGGPLVVVGTCSGAFLAYGILCEDRRVRGAVAVNLYCFYWRSEADIDRVLHNSFRSAATYAGLLRRGDAWRRLLRGEIRIAAILRALARGGSERARQRIARQLPWGPAARLRTRMADLRRRDARLHLLYSAGEPGLADLAAELGPSPARIARQLGRPARILADTDHNLCVPGAQDRLFAEIEALLAGLRGS